MATPDPPAMPGAYDDLLRHIKRRVEEARLRTAISVNRELILLYWRIGADILARQDQEGWGAKVIDRLAADLKRAFPEMHGFSARNLQYMRSFAEAWPDESFVQQVVAQIPWGHNVRILDKVPDEPLRRWYVAAVIEHGWSRDILVHQIETRLHLRSGRASTNFSTTLPAPQSDLAQQIIKDPYSFDFLSLGPAARERDLETGLLGHLREFLVELGVGFAFVGSQYPLRVGDQEYRLDLLFYHLKLRCFVVIDLKMRAFTPEDAGKMNFYLSAADELLRHPADQPTIGMILCKTKDRLVVEYALRDVGKPLGVSEFQLLDSLPPRFAGTLPTIDEIEAELGGSQPDCQKGT